MTNLKDYLGTLVASVNQARVLADIESANIAEQYAQHHLLKHFSIPRMKMQNVEFTIPVAINDMETSEAIDYQPIDNKTFVSKVYDELTNVYQVKSFDRTSSMKIRKILYKEADELETRLKAGEAIESALQLFSDKISDQTIQIKGDTTNVKERKKENVKKAGDTPISRDILSQKIIKRMQAEVKPKQTQRAIENANVIVEASKLREQKTENMVFIKMTVLEEGMEWHTINHENGETTSKLLPE
ncbi:MAG: hypothetical protein ACPGTO_06830 [Polaribacter sp.]